MIFARLYKLYGLGFFKKKYQPSAIELFKIQKNFQKYFWRDSHQKYLLTIIKVLAEKGKSTISEIVENDGFPQEKKRKETRQKIYSRIIEGSKDGKVKGLLPNQILHVAEKVLTSKLSKKYELSYFGVFLAIKIFTKGRYPLLDNMTKIDREKYDEYEKSIILESSRFLNNLASNYSHFLPLVFGKWDFIKKEFPEGIEHLIKFSEEGYYEQDLLEYDDPFMNSTIIEDMYPNGSSFHFFPEHYDWTEGNFFREEITMWFYVLLLRSDNENIFQQSLRKDKEIFSWFTAHTKRVIDRQNDLLSNSKNIQSWLEKDKPEKMNQLIQIALEEMEIKKWKNEEKLSILKKEILRIAREIEAITVVEKGMGHILDMEKYKKLVDEIEPLRMKLRDKTRKKIIKILKSWNFSKNIMIEYLSELHYILESEYSHKLFTITLGGGEKPGWGDIPIYQIPPEELRRWLKRYEWNAL